ncbi:MAG: Gmad2 immunoglobulin-like domain-containing protein [Acidimicrobiales bacterium]|nr:Gmad2 immunoglobulin-like domain-containing protein [Acidimicrobiales bacterium]
MNEQTPAPDPTGERLRRALAEHASTIQPSSDGLERIEETLMSESRFTPTRRWVVGGLSAAAAIILVVVGIVVIGSDDDPEVVADTTTTTEQDTTTTTTTTTTEPTTTTFTRQVDPAEVAYPSPDTSQRFQSAEAAGQSYATDVLGFTELELGEFREGDSRSGELPITDGSASQETVILLRKMADDTWYVLGSQFRDITVEVPEARDEISSPFPTSGEALAFEGTVEVIVRLQNDPMPLAEDFVTGSGVPPAGPFDKEIPFEAPDQEQTAILVYRTASAEDGHITAATSFPVQLLPS